MASPARPSTKRTADALPPPPIGLLTDDILADILLCLPTLADIGRAAASCAAFRRVVAGGAFLRRLRSVHRAPLLGLVLESKIKPAKPPHSSASYARALAGAADLSFTFLPSHSRWHAADARDGRVLLHRMNHYAVCDPLSRRYFVLPQIPENLGSHRWDLDPFLVPAIDEETETSFRVVCMRYVARTGQLVAFVFSSATGQWSSLPVGALVLPSCNLADPRCYAYGCFYWKVIGTDNLLVLDTLSMEFSLVQIPSGQGERSLAIVEAGEGRLGMFTVDNSMISAVSQLVYTIQEIDEDGSSRWRFERRIRLPSQNIFSFANATDRYLLLSGTPWNSQLGTPMNDIQMRYFSFDLESMRSEKMHVSRMGDLEHPILYAAFPPSLCLPSV